MKLGILISSLMVVTIIIVLVFALRGVPEQPTTNSRAENLKLRTDLDELPVMFDAGDGDAWSKYEAIFDFYRENRANLDGLLGELTSAKGDVPNPPKEISDKAIDLYIAAMEAGTVTTSQLDGTIKLWPNAAPEIGSPESVALLAVLRASYLYYEVPDQKQRALKAAKAVWCVGQTMYQKSNRVVIRTTGLELIKAAGTEMYNWSEDGSKLGADMIAWTEGLNKFERDYWIPKSEIVFGFKPNVGDLLNVALFDEDIAWKTEATLALGRIKWNARTTGNKKAIIRAIDDLMGDKEAVIRDAAKIADAFTAEDVRSLN